MGGFSERLCGPLRVDPLEPTNRVPLAMDPASRAARSGVATRSSPQRRTATGRRALTAALLATTIAGTLTGALLGTLAGAGGALAQDNVKPSTAGGIVPATPLASSPPASSPPSSPPSPSTPSSAAGAAPPSDDIAKKFEAMEQRIKALETDLKKKNEAAAAGTPGAPGTPGATPVAGKPGKPAPPGAPDWVTSTQPGAAPANPASPAAPGATPVAAKPGKPGLAGAPDWVTSTQPGAQPATPDAAPTADGKPATPPPGDTKWTTPTTSWNGPGTATANKGLLGIAPSPVTGLSIGAYGEMAFGFQQNPAALGQWQNGFDAHRLVLLPTYQITENIIFNAEIEFEHAGTGFDGDDKLHGTAEIEQVWVDFKIMDQFNWRAPGIDLIPFGYINEHHEPTQFYSVMRPELYNGLIPSTWKAPASSIYGIITEGLTYTIQASSSLEDFGDDFGARTDANTVPPYPIGYVAGIDGASALGFSLPARGDFKQLSNDIGVAVQLAYSPSMLPGFAGTTSFYYTPNTTPRGAYADNGMLLGRSSLSMFDSEFRYRIANTGWEARAEYVIAEFGSPSNLRANNDSDPTNNVGKSMYGYSAELAYHLPLGNILNSDWELVPFYRYTFQNFQTAGYAGTDVNAPTGAGQTRFHNVGIAVFPSPQIVLKLTWQKVMNDDPFGARSDSLLGGVGFFF